MRLPSSYRQGVIHRSTRVRGSRKYRFYKTECVWIVTGSDARRKRRCKVKITKPWTRGCVDLSSVRRCLENLK